MNGTVRLYGKPPYRVVLVHGGPGGAGEMSPMARVLGARTSLIEAMQTKLSVAALIDELKDQITAHAASPAVLVGHSWGAWLCLLFAARHPELAESLVLIASGVLEDRYAETMRETRLSRLTKTEAAEMAAFEARLADPTLTDKGALFGRYGYLFDKTENYDAEPEPKDRFDTDPAIFERVWAEASALRTSGELLRQAACVTCPVIAIHGDYDPSPSAGVHDPLARVLPAPFEFVVLKNCGHTPWLERQARGELYEVLGRKLPEAR
jgi:pimeloyl-ACP methyl ester carboxylesterase